MKSWSSLVITSSVLGSALFLAVACGPSDTTRVAMKPGPTKEQSNGSGLIRRFKGYKGDAQLSSNINGASATTAAAASEDPTAVDLYLKILLLGANNEPIALAGVVNDLRSGESRALTMNQECSNSKYEVEVHCATEICARVALRVIEKPEVSSPSLISALKAGQQIETSTYRQTGLVFMRDAEAAQARQATQRVRLAARKRADLAREKRKAESEISDEEIERQMNQGPNTVAGLGPLGPGRLVRTWSESVAANANVDVKTTFETGLANIKKAKGDVSQLMRCLGTPSPSLAPAAPDGTTGKVSTGVGVEAGSSNTVQMTED